tara:strand:+ start:64 stop:1410 length:1347 start_codon:yes stop_codon:yes gene_type:complete
MGLSHKQQTGVLKMPNIEITTEDQRLLDQLFSYGNHTSQPNFIDQLYMNTTSNPNCTYTRNCYPTIGWEIEFYIQPPTSNRPPLGFQDIKNRLIDFIQENNEWLQFNRLTNFAELGTDATPNENTIYELKIKPFALCDYSFNVLDKICNFLTNDLNAKINNKCGAHFHLGNKFVNGEEIDPITFTQQSWKHGSLMNLKSIMPLPLVKRVITRYALNQMILDRLQPRSRTNNRYALPIDKIINNRTISREWERSTTANDMSRVLGGKFNTVNMSSWGGIGTVEFRQGAGTLEVRKMFNWILLIVTMFYTSDEQDLDYSNNNNQVETTPEQPFRAGTRLDTIYQMCRTDEGATVRDMMLETGTSRSNIAGRISEMRQRFGRPAIVTHTQATNGASFGDGDEFARYQILKEFTIATNEIRCKADNQAGNPSIFCGIDDLLYQWFKQREQAL